MERTRTIAKREKMKNARAKMGNPRAKQKLKTRAKRKNEKTHVQSVQMISLLNMQICEVLVGVADPI